MFLRFTFCRHLWNSLCSTAFGSRFNAASLLLPTVCNPDTLRAVSSGTGSTLMEVEVLKNWDAAADSAG